MKIRWLKLLSIILTVVFIASLLSACTTFSGVRIGSSQSNSSKHMSSKFMKLSGEETKAIKLKEDELLTFTYDLKVESGDLKVRFINPKGDELVVLENDQKGKKQIKIDESGNYKIVVDGKDAKGSYDFKWETN